MTTNIYWPVYKNIENEFNNILFYIHVDDTQTSVYSSKISDLILRSAAEIESLSKELYTLNGGPKTNGIKYDEDAISYLNSKWFLEEKTIILSSYNCFLTNREIYPFKKNETRTGGSRMTYSWNNSYQNLKHDRAHSLHFGSVKYLLDAMAALYLLNIYYKETTFKLKKDAEASNFDASLGSSIFSIKLHLNRSVSLGSTYEKSPDFNQCTYFLKSSEETLDKLKKAYEVLEQKAWEATTNQITEAITKAQETDVEKIKKIIEDTQSSFQKENINRMMKAEAISIGRLFMELEYEALLNKNQI